VNRLLPILILLPGVLRIAELHPYEYAHYNLLVGGVSGAQGRAKASDHRARWAPSGHQSNIPITRPLRVEDAVHGDGFHAVALGSHDLKILKPLEHALRCLVFGGRLGVGGGGGYRAGMYQAMIPFGDECMHVVLGIFK